VVPYTPLEAALAANFTQAQKMTAGHRKLVVRTRKVFEQCVAGTGNLGSTIPKSGREGEKTFVRAFCRFLNRALVVKRGEVVGDRCLRYVDLFVKNLVEGSGEISFVSPP
jgi:condensin complex subunit 3